MRQLTILKDEPTAQRFAAWLVTQKIEAHAEQEKEGWAVWVREEDQLAAAKEQLAQFKLEPENPRYRNAVQQAAALEREEQQKRAQAQKNTIEMSRNWGRAGSGGIPKNRPLVLLMILASVVVGVLTSVGQSNHELIGHLQFNGARAKAKVGPDGKLRVEKSPVWAYIQAGQVWRLVTPMFLHFGWLHLIFNMLWLYDFGGQIEHQIKTFRFLLLVLVIAAFSSVVQVVASSFFAEPVFPHVGDFGGMSGVNYGLFGFLYIRAAVLREGHYQLHSQTIAIMFIWLFGCIFWNYLPRQIVGQDAHYVANGAHVGGLLIGMAIGYLKKFVAR